MAQRSPSRRVVIIESALVVIALVSLWPLLWRYYRPEWEWDRVWLALYRVWLVLMLGAMAWVASRRMARIRAAADEAKRIRDEMERGGRPPFLGR